MEQNKKTPQVRFKGYNDAWEQRKLGDICIEMLAGGDVDKEKIVEQGKYPVIANALTNEGVVGFYEHEYRVKAPAVTITGRGDVGHAKARKVDFTPVVRLLAIRTNHDVDFIENAINTLEVMVESTGVPQLTVPQLGKYELFIPPTIAEERIIGAYLRQLDYLITLHQRKYDKLINVKKAMFEKLFPKNGSLYPEIRFEGFTDAWEQRKLGELGTLKNGMNFSKEAIGVGFPFVNLQNIFGNNMINVNDLGLAMASEAQLKDYNLLEGDVLFVRSSVQLEGVGEAALVPINLENTTYSGFIIRFRDEYGLDKNFKRFIFGIDSIRSQIMSQATNSANKNINQSVLGNLDLKIPCKNEQVKIGKYFSNLDYLITLHQRKLEKLKNMKKSCLEKMFV